MKVELSAIVLKYRSLLEEKTHEAVCYLLALKQLEAENETLKKELEGYKGIPGDVPDELPPD